MISSLPLRSPASRYVFSGVFPASALRMAASRALAPRPFAAPRQERLLSSGEERVEDWVRVKETHITNDQLKYPPGYSKGTDVRQSSSSQTGNGSCYDGVIGGGLGQMEKEEFYLEPKYAYITIAPDMHPRYKKLRQYQLLFCISDGEVPVYMVLPRDRFAYYCTLGLTVVGIIWYIWTMIKMAVK